MVITGPVGGGGVLLGEVLVREVDALAVVVRVVGADVTAVVVRLVDAFVVVGTERGVVVAGETGADVVAVAVPDGELPAVWLPAGAAPMATVSASATPASAAGSGVTDWVNVTPRTAGVVTPGTRTYPRARAVAPGGAPRKAWNAAPASLCVGSTQLPVSVVASTWSPADPPPG
jgi:hypothetical protein